MSYEDELQPRGYRVVVGESPKNLVYSHVYRDDHNVGSLVRWFAGKQSLKVMLEISFSSVSSKEVCHKVHLVLDNSCEGGGGQLCGDSWWLYLLTSNDF